MPTTPLTHFSFPSQTPDELRFVAKPAVPDGEHEWQLANVDVKSPWWKLHLTHFMEFDENPGGDLVNKSMLWAKRGAFWGLLSGVSHAAIDRNQEFKTAARTIVRHTGFGGASFGVLAAGITASQFLLERNDGWPWAVGGAMGGFVFGLPGKRFNWGFRMAVAGAIFWSAFRLCEDYKDEWQTEPHPESYHPEKTVLQPILRL